MKNRLRKHVEKLCSIDRYYGNPDGIHDAREYIKSELKKIILEVENLCELKMGVVHYMAGGTIQQNVFFKLNSSFPELVVIGAHYDAVKGSPGADDNASAVAGLIETIREIVKNPPDFGIEFVFYSTEEPPFFLGKEMGSYVHAKGLNKEKKILGALVYEMIGFFSDEENSQQPVPMIDIPTIGNFIGSLGWEDSEEINKALRRGFIEINQIPLIGVSNNLLATEFALSDHISYHNFKIPTVMITDTSFLRNPNYHEPSDTPDTLNYEKMSHVIKGVVNSMQYFRRNHFKH
ncbi:M28 family peptidase [archaeon]|jgi:hypothetical protein|nr:M28 family peptidase [archaeon]